MFNPTREQSRLFIFNTWEKSKASMPLTDLESKLLEIIVRHPEYHMILDYPNRFQEKDYGPESGQTNPFLHFNLHLALREMLDIDQPVGIRAEFENLCQKTQDLHNAEHILLERIAEMIWHSQRYNTAPDDRFLFSNPLEQ